MQAKRPHQQQQQLSVLKSVFCVTCLMDASGQPSGAAQRRRQRRMRSWWRHEQTSIAAAVPTGLHHPAQRGGGVERRPTGTEDSGNREEVEHATHYGPRAQKTPPPGERPGILVEPGPQRSDRSLRHSSGEALPTLPPCTGWGVGRGGGLLRSLLLHSPSAGGQEEGRGGGAGGKAEEDARRRGSSQVGAPLAARRASVTPYGRAREQAQRSHPAACGVQEEEEE